MTGDHGKTQSDFNTNPSIFPSTHVMHLLIPCDEGDHVLAKIGPENVARLPSIRIPLSDNKYDLLEILERKVEERFAFPVCLVRSTGNGIEDDIDNPGCKVLQDIWIVHPAGDIPPMIEPLKWVHEDDVPSYKWVDVIRSHTAGHVLKDVEGMFEDIEIGTFDIRVKPWEALGFFKQIASWSREVLKRRNMVMEGRIRSLRCSGDNAKLFTYATRMQDDGQAGHEIGRSEVIFIKCTVPMAREVERTVAVASVFGEIVPEILGFDAQRGVLMQRDAGTMTEDALNFEVLFDTVLHLQLVSLSHIPELEAKGLPIMDVEWLEPRLESILNHGMLEEFLACQEECKIECEDERDTIKSFRSKTGEFRKMCRRVSELGLPNTIVHGDCHVDNIGISTTTKHGKFYRLFDWATCHIGSPLVDLQKILPRGPEDVMSQKEWEAGVRRVCEEWKQLACLTYGEVRKLFDDVECLQLLLVLYEWEELFDVCTAKAKEDDDFGLGLKAHQIRIFDSLEDLIRNFGDEKRRIDRETRR